MGLPVSLRPCERSGEDLHTIDVIALSHIGVVDAGKKAVPVAADDGLDVTVARPGRPGQNSVLAQSTYMFLLD